MDREAYEKALDQLYDEAGETGMTISTYYTRLDALKRKYGVSQQEKPSENRSVGTGGT